jgi:N-acetyl sugar amidotransferase
MIFSEDQDQKLMKNNSYNREGLLKGIRYCTRCCMPETQEGITFDEMGICQACQSSEQKIHIDWVEREKQLREILNQAKQGSGNNYDCIVPISGGKDSTFQVHVLVKTYGMKPLAVTFNHNWYSETGWYNLQNTLDRFNIDHIMFTPNRDLVNRIARRSLDGIGDACWHCHAGVGAFPLQVAVKFRIPLLVWGESISDSSGRASYQCPVHKFDRDYFTKVSAKLKPEEMVCDYLTERDLYPFNVPSLKEIEDVGVVGIHLGDYIFWDDERQTEFVRDHYDWKETEIEGTYKGYKSAECMMPGVHDFTCYLKRGFGRASFHASVDIRNGLMTREEGIKISKKYDSEIPEALDYYLKITGMNEDDFYHTMKKHRVKKLETHNLQMRKKKRHNKEKIQPFVEELIEEKRKKKNTYKKN